MKLDRMGDGSRRIIVALLLGLCLTATAHAAPEKAPDKAKAREAFRIAIRHYNLDEFKEALESFKEAYRSFDDPSFLFNIGQCERQLGQKQEALHSYKAYLRESPSAPNRGEVARLINGLEAALRQEQSSRGMPPTGVMPDKGVAPAEPTPPATSPSGPSPSPASPSSTTPSPSVETPPPAQPDNGASLTATSEAPKTTPVYKRWWLWTVVGVVAAGAAVGVAVAATRPAAINYPSSTTTNGTLHF
jgi:tetratricopeptide (TPR) repeat protein